MAREIGNILREKTGIALRIVRVQRTGAGTVVTLASMKDKISIMRRRGELRGSGVWIGDDLTAREVEVTEFVRSEANAKRREGKITSLGYLKMCVNGSWWYWVEREGRMERVPFRNERGQQ